MHTPVQRSMGRECIAMKNGGRIQLVGRQTEEPVGQNQSVFW